MAEDQDSGDKTEEPTAHKLNEARKKGDVPKGQEIPTFAVLAAGAVGIAALGGTTASGVADLAAGPWSTLATQEITAAALTRMLRDLAFGLVLVLAPLFLILALAGLFGHLGQTGLLFTASKIEPKLSKLNPVDGLKRMFGPSGFSNFAKGVGKMAIVGAACLAVMWPDRHLLPGLVELEPLAMLAAVHMEVLKLCAAALAAYLVLAIIDYVAARHAFMKKQRMSHYDIKQEFKQTDGDPMVKARIRQIRQERTRKRMMAAVPDATVVIANPTHYAVALRYEPGEDAAPVCVAKGVDLIALQIRRVASEHDVPVREDPPLARALYASSELDQPVSPQHYAALALIIGEVLRAAGHGSRARR